MSYRGSPTAIISIAQQASPKVSGQTLDWRAQLIACSTVVVMTFSSKRPSIHGCETSFTTILLPNVAQILLFLRNVLLNQFGVSDSALGSTRCEGTASRPIQPAR